MIESIWSYKLTGKISKNEHAKFVDNVEKILSAEMTNMLKITQDRINTETEEILNSGIIKLDIKFIDPEQSPRVFQQIKMHK